MEDYDLEVQMLNKTKGIYGNSECDRCGACCVCFEITESFGNTEKVVKKAGEVCDFLYQDDKGNFGCSEYNGGRPYQCEKFFCSEEYLFQNTFGDDESPRELQQKLRICAGKIIREFEKVRKV